MGRYLDPKSDLVFKRVFGEHPHLLKSFLNAVLPLPDDGQIETLEYLPSEQVPAIPILKRTIVDVKCKDRQGRIFIVEMQVEWTDHFKQRLLFGTASAYVKQLQRGEHYELLNPVYGLGLVDSIFDEKSKDWYHHYGLVKLNNAKEEIINGLSLIFLELPKFVPSTPEEKRLRVLWLRYMREVNDSTRVVDPELLKVPEINEAVQLAEEAGYTTAQLAGYEDYWKAVSSERTMREADLRKGREEGRAEGRLEGKLEIVRMMKDKGLLPTLISQYTGLPEEAIEQLES